MWKHFCALVTENLPADISSGEIRQCERNPKLLQRALLTAVRRQWDIGYGTAVYVPDSEVMNIHGWKYPLRDMVWFGLEPYCRNVILNTAPVVAGHKAIFCVTSTIETANRQVEEMPTIYVTSAPRPHGVRPIKGVRIVITDEIGDEKPFTQLQGYMEEILLSEGCVARR
ncbi:MAG: hypothetical protein A2836_01970 [Candidatus Taylorbacteria bacterium RIFCSPHIGHO2_01_FULL_45_63]|nr:MAG: hypothetical protein A2836_01970 [Candidatus Taylorbacteria bacterium RIFCSPHIGHO2_01_FULL_45_63]OHA34484.1 MAG: hypothetical protein A3A22_02620 [Candidatus Taylorbacteria bacterium RIFCSPLOWO2_01_FULL_45_34b]